MRAFLEVYFQSNSILNSVSPILMLGRLTGMVPFEYQVVSGITTSVISLPWFCFNMFRLAGFSYSFLALILHPNVGKVWKETSQVYYYAELTQIYAGFLTTVFLVVFKFVKSYKIATNFTLLDEMDKLFEGLGFKIDYTLLKMKMFIAVIVQMIYFASCILVTIQAGRVSITLERCLTLGVIFTSSVTTCMGQFICSSLIYLVWLRINSLNKEIIKIKVSFRSNQKDADVENNKISVRLECIAKPGDSNFRGKIDIIWKVYAKICNCSHNLNDYLSIITFTLITLSFINTMFNAYYVIYIIATGVQTYRFPYLLLFLRMVRCFVNGLNIFWFAYICNFCEDEVIFSTFKKIYSAIGYL